MERVKSVCIFIVLCGFCHGAKRKTHVIYPHEDQIVVEEGKELRLECYSHEAKPIQFSFPETETLIPRSKHDIFESPNGTYTFLRRQMTPKDAGWYACAEKNVHIDNDFRNLDHTQENISWIYVYVQGGEFSESFATAYLYKIPRTLIAFAGSNAIVPCRPTSPTAKVELWQNFKPALIDYIVAYDSQIGFIINHADFEAGEAILQCKIWNTTDDYNLRLSGPKPKMISPNDKDVVLQEGNELRIECYSGFPVSFMFPNMIRSNSSIQSEYEISTSKNGSHTFIRRHVISEDTGWYGCAGEGVQNNIPNYSIDDTQKEIDWIYVSVETSASVTRELMVQVHPMLYWYEYKVIPCQPTSPKLEINLSTWLPTNLDTSQHTPFQSQLGVVVKARINSRSTLYCTTDKVRDYADTATILSVDADHPSRVRPINDLIIRRTGESLSMDCDVSLPDVTFFRLEWEIPNTVSEDRVQYVRIRADNQWQGSTNLKRQKLITTISSLRKTDSGEYRCRIDNHLYPYSVRQIFVEVFDENEGQYMKLSKQGGGIQVTGREGETFKLLLNLEDFPLAEIKWIDPLNNTSSARAIRDFSNKKAQLQMFVKEDLTLGDSGVYLLYADLGTEGSSTIKVTLNVQALPKAAIQKLARYSYIQGEHLKVPCTGNIINKAGEPNITWSFIKCPKFPSLKDSVPMSSREINSNAGRSKDSRDLGSVASFYITMSGILTCQVCNALVCNTDRIEILSSASREPYFTSTNMNESEAISNLEMDKNSNLTLECYASGRPNPKVTWYKGNKLIVESCDQFIYAHENRQLTIQFLLDWNEGRYKCRAENEHGTVERYIDITIKGVPDILRSSLIAAVPVLLVVIVTSWLVIWKQRIKAREEKLITLALMNGDLDCFNPELLIVDQARLLPYDQKWEFPRELLTLDKVLGRGAFGIVRKAEAKSICRGEPLTTVAVKLVLSTASLNYMTALTRELRILGYLGHHPNVVNLLGACTRNVSYGELFVIVEFCRFGNLRDYLRRSRANFVNQIGSRPGETVAANDDTNRIGTTNESPDANDIASIAEDSHQTGSTSTDLRNEEDVFGLDSGKAHCLRSKYEGDYADLTLGEVSTRDLVYWAWQISRGMKYLGKRKVVHGDLAARNVLLADNNIVKICDFGLSKTLYEEAQYRDQGTDPLPVKWMAIESIKDRVFSYQSDIWSFGVVMWELFTLGETPYHGIRHNELYHKLNEGHRMEQPKYATSVIYDTMLDCWKADPLERRSFTEIGHNLANLLDEGCRMQYLEMTSTYMKIDAEMLGHGRKDYLTLPPSAFDASSSSAIREEIEMKNLPQNEFGNPI